MLLAIDTASRVISLALRDEHQLRFESTWRTRNNHTVELAPAIRQALIQTGIAPADLTAVAISQGPGSFTGLRIGLGVAKGLAMAQQIALIAIPTLDIVAAGVPCFDGTLIATLQAGRGRLCAQRYGWRDDGWTPAGEAAITTWSHLIAAVERDTLFAGEIDDAGRALLETIYRPARIAPAAHCLRRAGFLAEMAWMRLKTGHLDDPARVTPIYLHQPGAPHP